MLIDTHFHLDLMENMRPLIKEFKDSDIGIIAVGTTPKAYVKETQFCVGTGNIKVGLGFHPQLVAERWQEIDQFLQLLDRTRFIGEIGLDFNSAYLLSKTEQVSCFRRIVKPCAERGNKVLSIHSVKAAKTVLDELERAGTFKDNICILHWFTGTGAERMRAIEDGAYFSINPRMLKTKSGQETIKALPLDRILLETDAPFTLKIDHVNELKMVLEKLIYSIAEVRGDDVDKIWTMIENNSMDIWNRE